MYRCADMPDWPVENKLDDCDDVLIDTPLDESTFIDGYVVIDNFGQRYEYEFWYVVFYYGSIGMETSNRITFTPAEFTDYGTYKT